MVNLFRGVCFVVYRFVDSQKINMLGWLIMDTTGNVSLFKANLQQNNNLFSQPNPNDPGQTKLYFEKKFSDIFSGFLNTSLDPNSSDMLGSSSSSNELDFFGTNATDPFAANTNLQLAQLNLSQNQFLGTQNLDLMNQSAAIIGKQASYVQNGTQYSGLVDSVVNDNGVISFRIEGVLVPMQSIQEIRGATHA